MIRIFTILLVLFTLSVSAQIGEKTVYDDSSIYRIDTTVYFGTSDSNIAPSYVRFNYHYISPDSVWESQLIVIDSTGKYLVPIPALVDSGAGASGTTWFTKLDSASVLKTPIELCDSLFLPRYRLYIGTTTKL